MSDKNRVSGRFEDPVSAQTAVQHLLSAHFEPESILIVETDGEGAAREVSVERRIFDWRVAAVGGLVGVVGGAVIGALIAIGVIDGTLFSDTPAVLMLQALIGGFGTGALAGYVMGLAMWDARPRFSERASTILVGVEVGARRVEAIEGLLTAAGAQETTATPA